eukprot:1959105-Amphidinium_carterae.1
MKVGLGDLKARLGGASSSMQFGDAFRAIVLKTVAKNGLALEYQEEELKGDRAIVLAAVGQTGFALQYAAQELKGDAAI